MHKGACVRACQRIFRASASKQRRARVYTQKCTRLTPNGTRSRSLINAHTHQRPVLSDVALCFSLGPSTDWRKDLTRIKPNEILMRKVLAVWDNIPQYSRLNDFSSREICVRQIVCDVIHFANDKRCLALILFFSLTIYSDNCYITFMFPIRNSNFRISIMNFVWNWNGIEIYLQ